MIIPITFPSAAAFWLNYRDGIDLEKTGLRLNLPAVFHLPADTSAADMILNHFRNDYPLTVISPDGQRSYGNNKIFHALIHPAHIPPDSFVELRPDIYVASPEYCFLQAACVLSFENLVLFGNDLCAGYIHDENAVYKQHSRIPVTDKDSIRHYLNSARNCYGFRKASQAARFLLNNSNSPMESMLAVFTCLPFSKGGYALKAPELNKKILLSDEGKKIMQGSSCISDLVWEQEKLIVEYDSDISHLTSHQHALDKQRSSALAASGYKVISITRKNVEYLSALDETFILLRKLLGMRSESSQIAYYINIRRRVLSSFRKFHSYNPGTYRI